MACWRPPPVIMHHPCLRQRTARVRGLRSPPCHESRSSSQIYISNPIQWCLVAYVRIVLKIVWHESNKPRLLFSGSCQCRPRNGVRKYFGMRLPIAVTRHCQFFIFTKVSLHGTRLFRLQRTELLKHATSQHVGRSRGAEKKGRSPNGCWSSFL